MEIVMSRWWALPEFSANVIVGSIARGNQSIDGRPWDSSWERRKDDTGWSEAGNVDPSGNNEESRRDDHGTFLLSFIAFFFSFSGSSRGSRGIHAEPARSPYLAWTKVASAIINTCEIPLISRSFISLRYYFRLFFNLIDVKFH